VLSLDYLDQIGLKIAVDADVKAIAVDALRSATNVAPETACPSRTLRVLSFNVLFPNSETSGVWWIYKYYDADAADMPTSTGRVDMTDWRHRAALLRRLVERIDADVVCFQEPWNSRGAPKLSGAALLSSSTGNAQEDVAQATFKADFAFMETLGYEGELLAKGNIRPATFWKGQGLTKTKTEPAKGEAGAMCPCRGQDQRPLGLRKLSSAHKVSRALVTLFEVCLSEVDDTADDSLRCKPQLVAVVNCHLTAAPQGNKERLSTVEDALKAAARLYSDVAQADMANAPKGKKGKSSGNLPAALDVSVVLCGDFNSSGGLADIFLTEGEVGPDDTIGLKRKAHSFPKFVDCGKGMGPTLIVPNIDTLMLRPIEERELLPANLVEKAKQLQDALGSATGRCDESGGVKATSACLDGEVFRALNEQVLMPQLLVRLRQCFDKIKETPSGLPDRVTFADDEISGRQVNWWLRSVNRELGRGTEFRHAREIQFRKKAVLTSGQGDTGVATRASEEEDDGLPPLTFQEFATVWRLECEEGKYWGLEHDLQKLCGCGMRKHGDVSYQGRFDYIYVSSASPGGLRLAGAEVVALFPETVGGQDDKLQSLTQLELASGGIDSFVLPNAWHPSDHLPVVVDLAI